nr:hypothetical protein [Tanacetum cinerariifolium]
MERWKQIRNKDLRTELKYFSKDYDEEKEMEPRPVRIRETTSVIRTREVSKLSFTCSEWLPFFWESFHLVPLWRIEAREVATNEASNDQREGFDRSRKNPSWDNNKGHKNKDRFSLYRGSNHGLLSNFSKSPKEILATEMVVMTFEQPPRMLRNRRSCDMTKYCHFYEDHRHDTNDFRELSHQIEESQKSRQLSYLLKGIKKAKKMGIVVSMIDGAIKFHTPQGIGIVFLTYEFEKMGKKKKAQGRGKPFNTEHKLNEYKHIKPVKQKKHGLGPDRNAVACKEVEELMKEGILRKRLASYTNGRKGRRKNGLFCKRRNILLPKDAFRFKERQCYLLETGGQVFGECRHRYAISSLMDTAYWMSEY